MWQNRFLRLAIRKKPTGNLIMTPQVYLSIVLNKVPMRKKKKKERKNKNVPGRLKDRA